MMVKAVIVELVMQIHLHTKRDGWSEEAAGERMRESQPGLTTTTTTVGESV